MSNVYLAAALHDLSGRVRQSNPAHRHEHARLSWSHLPLLQGHRTLFVRLRITNDQPSFVALVPLWLWLELHHVLAVLGGGAFANASRGCLDLVPGHRRQQWLQAYVLFHLTTEVSCHSHATAAGAEVVQAYVSPNFPGAPIKQLVGFQKVFLNPGKQKNTVPFRLD